MDWQTVAMALGTVLFVLVGAVCGWVASILARVVEGLADVARITHGHGIRLDYLDGVDHEKP